MTGTPYEHATTIEELQARVEAAAVDIPAIQGTPTADATIILREAASALHSALTPDTRTPWQDLPFAEQSMWGRRAGPSVLAVLMLTKPEGWEATTEKVLTFLDMWARAGVPRQLGEEA